MEKVEEAKYVARMIAHKIGRNPKNGNKFVAATFQLHGGKCDGAAVGMYKANTPQTVEALNKMFRACGWKGGKNPPKQEELTNLVSIDVRRGSSFERDGRTFPGALEVAFVNPLSSVKQVATQEETNEFFADLALVDAGEYFDENNDYSGEGHYDAADGAWTKGSAPAAPSSGAPVRRDVIPAAEEGGV